MCGSETGKRLQHQLLSGKNVPVAILKGNFLGTELSFYSKVGSVDLNVSEVVMTSANRNPI